ncbi:hypothetical protein NTJ12_002273 [Flavobacterium psychrophilum]|nr:hypothetical protein [Flavobacterium psychrophilum]
MKLTKKTKVFLIVLAILFSPLVFYKLQGTKIYWLKFDSKKIGKNNGDIFIIQNPPSTKDDLIRLIEEMNDTLDLKYSINKKTYYVQYFYKENFHLTRFFKPYYATILGNYVDIRVDNDGDFDKEHLVDYVYNNEAADKNCGMWCPI